ncbi:haloacid dehalogenase type II [Aquibaculum arenosum]|uniref:Haloacid dehalogenase type II n=1 Tax=Aquibaculum arenosum TaxID=3032591 RepID=A0ABT5YKZ8_9PROT|nr:haloacid dehalogenase type II [Fodinicurvata sp. CAU 1616]MDF2095626.1 haloacid dehalogenase type II [Fodinicurvata sp. CAU 1616]
MKQGYSKPKALLFDVFGTLVDWRGSLIRQLRAFGEARGLDQVDWPGLADAWRGRYAPSMDEVRSGRRAWTVLDDLHRESLLALLPKFGLEQRLEEEEIEGLVRGWHRLDPWPDVSGGLARLHERFLLAPLSNGNVALMANLKRHAKLPWDCILGAELARHYKPDPEVYLTAMALLRLAPQEVMMVAAHNDDLAQAQALGMQTAFVPRPTEHGPNQTTDLAADGAWDFVVASTEELADRLCDNGEVDLLRG